jgi:hypothetical protein
MITKEEERRHAEDAARRILDALEALPPHQRFPLALALIADDSSRTMQRIGEAYLCPHHPPALAERLLRQVFIGDAAETANKLSASAEPWSTIRAALLDTVAAWRASRAPGARTAHDNRLRMKEWSRRGTPAPRTSPEVTPNPKERTNP